ncbi:nitroreductase [Bosea caraganae]|uniref:Putative NAD(P)H nitroreductase n=1 Tax=Bosea caraganae TaxID=2763117 RepID=A0A370L2G4_9HYPH|nr:nitroreductase [Bosea caraganae]RDJ22140.1 nitroreductase [Bosea caraganae]RDJ22773.1 nitroreductase [Bosea caraganae]
MSNNHAAAATEALSHDGEALLSFLERRRSTGMTALSEPGPSESELRRILTIAARVPDHGGIEPWRFIVLAGDARQRASEGVSKLYAAENAAMDPERREKFTAIMGRALTYAPVIVLVVSRSDALARVLVWEQELSTGAACMNLVIAAQASGYGTTWLTGWAAYSPGVAALFGLSGSEKVAGVIHIGTAKEIPPDRKRPDIDALTTYW